MSPTRKLIQFKNSRQSSALAPEEASPYAFRPEAAPSLPIPEAPEKCDSPVLHQKAEQEASSIAPQLNRSQSELSSLLAYQASFIRDEEEEPRPSEHPRELSSPMRRGLFALQQCEIQEEEENSLDGCRFAVGEDSSRRWQLEDVASRTQKVPSSFCLGAE